MRLACESSPALITTADIATAIGVTQGAVFKHFPTKDAIWLAAMRWVRETLLHKVRAAAEEAATPVDALALSLGLGFRRLQCTPDLLPNDVLGVSIYRQNEGSFSFQPGPIFTNILLADEINRATPRTQSALLEAMGEGQVTVEGETRDYAGRFFCPRCGSPVFGRSGDEVEVNLGSLDAPDRFKPTYELWTIRREPWLPPFPGVQTYERERTGPGDTV